MSRALCLWLTLLIAPGYAAAQAARSAGSPWYATLGGGQASIDAGSFVSRELPVPVVPDSTRVASGSDGSASRLAIGYRFNPAISVEAGYTSYGRSRIGSTFTVMRGIAAKVLLEPGELSVNRKASAFGADVVASWPLLERLSILGRAGAVLARTSTAAATTVEASIGNGAFFSDGEGGFTRSGKSSDTVLRYGAGLEWAFARDFGARLEWERLGPAGRSFRDGGADPTGKASLDLWSAGMVWRF
jgi:opacity protein-like surface antigen